MIDLTYTTRQESFVFEVASSIIMAIFLLFLGISLIRSLRIVVAIMSIISVHDHLECRFTPRLIPFFCSRFFSLPDSHNLSMACFL